MKLEDLRIKIFADGADLETMIRLNDDPLIKGLTTNPTLMRKAGITNYEAFAKEVLKHVTKKPISFEVFSDDFAEMERQARKISGWGENVYVKIPIVNSVGHSSLGVVRRLMEADVKVNLTAIMSYKQIAGAMFYILPKSCILSFFNGRIADTGRHPEGQFSPAREFLLACPLVETLWASTREVWNICEADALGYRIITVPDSILSKAREMAGKDLNELSVETVQMFKKDAEGYTL
jgi:transaldolase